MASQVKESCFPPMLLCTGAPPKPGGNRGLATGAKNSVTLSPPGAGSHQPDFLQHRWLPDPGFCLVTNIADGHMASL